MKKIAARATLEILARIQRAIRESPEYSLRGLARATEGLSPPERIHHTQLSQTLRGVFERNLYFQQYLVICRLLNEDPLTFLFDTDLPVSRQLARAARKLEQLSPAQRKHALDIIDSLAAADLSQS